jgi:uncharacterized protein (TIGR00369 family)
MRAPPPTDSPITSYLASAPFVRELGIHALSVEPERVELLMPYRPELTTSADYLHAGALATLVVTAATAVSWSTPPKGDASTGAIVDVDIRYLEPAGGEDLLAVAKPIRRGRSLSLLDVAVRTSQGLLVAKSLATYKLNHPQPREND